MATSTLLQSLNTDADFGGVSAAASSNRRQVEIFLAKETLVVGDWVAFDFDATADSDVTLGIFKADGNSSPVRTPFGVVLRSAEPTGTLTSGSRIEVVTAGVCDALTSDAAGAGMAVGAILQITNTAGVADAASAASAQPVCGVLAEVVAAAAGQGLRRVVVRKSF
jgi:hypothetical protein